jgi:hypothetical protein
MSQHAISIPLITPTSVGSGRSAYPLEYIRRHSSSIRFGSASITHRSARSPTIAATVWGPKVAT